MVCPNPKTQIWFSKEINIHSNIERLTSFERYHLHMTYPINVIVLFQLHWFPWLQQNLKTVPLFGKLSVKLKTLAFFRQPYDRASHVLNWPFQESTLFKISYKSCWLQRNWANVSHQHPRKFLWILQWQSTFLPLFFKPHTFPIISVSFSDDFLQSTVWGKKWSCFCSPKIKENHETDCWAFVDTVKQICWVSWKTESWTAGNTFLATPPQKMAKFDFTKVLQRQPCEIDMVRIRDVVGCEFSKNSFQVL